MKLRTIHVSRYAPVMPSLWVDTAGAKPVLKAYVNGRYQTLSGEIPTGILTQDMIVNSLDSDAVDMPLSAAQGKILKSLLDGKQDTLTPGTGIEITDDNTINVTLDTTVFKVVSSLPDSPASEDVNKIHLVPSESTGENNSYKEYLWVNDEWEEIGTYVSTVDLAPYLTKEDAGKIYQKLTDDSLQTQNKTVVGGINEVNAGLKEVVKPYVINLTDLLAAQDSESISAAIGGIDNLNGTVQKNQAIFGTLANGTVAVGIRVLGNQTTLTYFVDSVVGLTVNEVIITNTSGTLTKAANTHAVLTENMVVNNLESDETTLPLSAAQGKVLSKEVETNTSDVTRIDKAIGNPTEEEHNLTAAESGKYWSVNGQKTSSTSFNLSNIISLKKGDLLRTRLNDSSVNVSLITKVSSNGDFVESVVPARAVGGGKTWFYIADNDCYVQISYSTGSSDKYIIIKSPFNIVVSDNSYTQYLHKVYKSYGAVYNKSTGYWELNGLADLTEEDMWDIYLAGVPKTNDLTEFYAAPSTMAKSIRTTFNLPSIQGGGTGKGAILRGTFMQCANLEVVQFNKNKGVIINLRELFMAFYNCSKLREIGDILAVYLQEALTDNMFYNCKALESVKLQRLRTDISFKDSPLLSYESIKYLVDNAANTAAITVTVHPTTYSYLTGTAQPTAEVGGTTDEWQALVTTAQGKQISFAVPEETQSEVTE